MSTKCDCLQVKKQIFNDLGCINNVDGVLLAFTCVSMIWNMSAPLPASRLGILMSTVEPGSLLGPLFIAWEPNHTETGKK